MYKIQETQACGNYDLEINNKSINDFSEKEMEDFVNHLMAEFKNGLKDGSCLLIDLIKCFQTENCVWEEDVCDCCGDSKMTTSWII